MAPSRRIGRLTAHLWPVQSAGGDGDGSDDEDGSDEDDDFLLLDDDDEAFGDDDLADMLAAFDDVEGGDDEDDMFALDEPGEDELLEQLRDPDPSLFNAAAVALRKLWREREGPFAADELDAAVGHLRRRVQSRGGALKAIKTAASALRAVVEEYPDWAEPLNELATCELLRANSDESVRLGRQVLEMQPNHFDCLARLCLSYAITGDDSEGEAAAQSLESVCPGLASPIRQLATALSAALQQAANNGEGSSRPEQIRLEIDPATLETLGPILQGMGGFGDAMQGGLGGAGEGAAEEEEEGEEGERDWDFEGEGSDILGEGRADGEGGAEGQEAGPPLRLLYNPRAELDSSAISPFFHPVRFRDSNKSGNFRTRVSIYFTQTSSGQTQKTKNGPVSFYGNRRMVRRSRCQASQSASPPVSSLS